jgi:hypothetical protein
MMSVANAISRNTFRKWCGAPSDASHTLITGQPRESTSKSLRDLFLLLSVPHIAPSDEPVNSHSGTMRSVCNHSVSNARHVCAHDWYDSPERRQHPPSPEAQLLGRCDPSSSPSTICALSVACGFPHESFEPVVALCVRWPCRHDIVF